MPSILDGFLDYMPRFHMSCYHYIFSIPLQYPVTLPPPHHSVVSPAISIFYEQFSSSLLLQDLIGYIVLLYHVSIRIQCYYIDRSNFYRKNLFHFVPWGLCNMIELLYIYIYLVFCLLPRYCFFCYRYRGSARIKKS